MRTKITGTQFALLLLLSRMCSLFIFTPVFNSVQTSTAMLVGNLVSMAIQILILIPISMFWNKNPNVSILDYLLSKNKIISKIIIFSFLGFFIFQAINTLFHFEFFLSNTAYPKVSALPIILLITICCVYTAKLGIEGICRGGFIIFFIFLIGLISIFALTMKYFDILNIKPIVLEPAKLIFESTIKNFSRNSELLLLLIFAPNVKSSMTKCSLKYIIITGAIFEIITFVMQGVLGEYLMKQTFPFYALSTISGAKILGRLDAVQMTLWIILSFVRITIFLLAANICFKKLRKKEAKSNFSIYIIAILIAISAYVFSQNTLIINAKYISYILSLIILFLVFIVPLLTNLFYKKELKGESVV